MPTEKEFNEAIEKAEDLMFLLQLHAEFLPQIMMDICTGSKPAAALVEEFVTHIMRALNEAKEEGRIDDTDVSEDAMRGYVRMYADQCNGCDVRQDCREVH